MKRNRRWRWVAALGLSSALLLGCGTTDGPDEAPATSDDTGPYREGMVNVQENDGDPVTGGSITVAGFVEPRSLDPAKTTPAGSAGGIELLNIYDSLLRYDTERGELVGQLAESVEPNDDSTEFTIRLRDGVQFSDGTPLDADAVKKSMDRYAASPTAPEGALWSENVASVEVGDEGTVVIGLNNPYPGFSNLLATGPGMIVAPTADSGTEFTPIGAGPFTVASMKPQEEIILAANESYWDGAPHLDQVRFVYFNDEGITLDSLANGNINVGFLRSPNIVDDALEETRPGYLSMVAAGGSIMINANPDRPGSDVRVRQAMALALDPELINERAFGGKGIGSSNLFPDYSRWHSDVGGPAFDPERARELLDEAKADGFDGRIGYVTSGSPTMGDIALSLKAQWEAVGFSVDVTQTRTSADLFALGMSGDYDTSSWAMSFREADPYAKMSAVMHSGGKQTYGMHTSPEMDELIDQLRSTPGDEQAPVIERIQELYNEELPFISISPYAELVAWDDNVHGVVGAGNSMVMFHQAWLG